MEAKLKTKVRVPERPEYVCALGAALLGMRRYQQVSAEKSTPAGFAAGQSAGSSVQTGSV